MYFVLLFSLTTTGIVAISELVIGPSFQWLLYDSAYTLPDWERAKRLVLGILFIGFLSGTVSWYYEKRISGR
jgi:hypothetical protein